MDWDKLRIFHAAAEAGSFTHAGETLSISQSAVSRHISALERDLNVPLFHRHARGLCQRLQRPRELSIGTVVVGGLNGTDFAAQNRDVAGRFAHQVCLRAQSQD